MKFRNLHWATEQVSASGSTLTGVFTSIPDLVHHGLRWLDEVPHREGFRVSLVQLDSPKLPLGTWSSPNFEGMSDELRGYVASDGFNPQETEELIDRLRDFANGGSA